LQDRTLSLKRLGHLKAKKTPLVTFEHREIVVVKVELSVTRNIWQRSM